MWRWRQNRLKRCLAPRSSQVEQTPSTVVEETVSCGADSVHSRSGQMAVSLLLLLLPLLASAETDPLDKPCEGSIKCLHKAECKPFGEAVSKMRAMAKDSSEKKEMLSKLKGMVCNKAKKAVCCEQPDSGCDPANGSCLPGLGRCGLAGSEHRITEGNDTRPGEFPFTALLGTKRIRRGPPGSGIKTMATVFTCGGTLINLRYVLTAAHCHDPDNKRKQISVVRLGEYEVTDKKRKDCTGHGETYCLKDVQDFDIEPDQVIMHPDFEADPQGRVTNDIALIRLPRPAQENLAVKVACLPIDPQLAAAQLNVPDIREGLASFYPTVVGWGYTKSNPFDQKIGGGREKVAESIQQKLAVPVLTDDQCSSKLDGFTPRSDQICAGGEKGSTCSVSIPSPFLCNSL